MHCSLAQATERSHQNSTHTNTFKFFNCGFLIQGLNTLWQNNPTLLKTATAFAGSLAGVTAVFLTYPLDTIRARLAFQVTGEHLYTGIMNAAVTIYRTVSKI